MYLLDTVGRSWERIPQAVFKNSSKSSMKWMTTCPIYNEKYDESKQSHYQERSQLHDKYLQWQLTHDTELRYSHRNTMKSILSSSWATLHNTPLNQFELNLYDNIVKIVLSISCFETESATETNKVNKEDRITDFSCWQMGVERTVTLSSGSISLQLRHQRFVTQFLK